MQFPMNTPWGYPDFDAHEALHFVTDEATGLRAIIAMHSTHLGPAAGGTRFWHYADDAEALTDALRLSRGMSYKNAMAGLPLGGGKAVVLANKSRTKTPEMLAAFGAAVNSLGREICHRRGRRHVGRRHDRNFEADQVRRRLAGRRRRGRRRSGTAYLARRVPWHQGGGEARTGQGQPQWPSHRLAGRRQRRRRRRSPGRGRRREAFDRRCRSGPCGKSRCGNRRYRW